MIRSKLLSAVGRIAPTAIVLVVLAFVAWRGAEHSEARDLTGLAANQAPTIAPASQDRTTSPLDAADTGHFPVARWQAIEAPAPDIQAQGVTTYSVAITPTTAAGSGPPGAAVLYSLQLTNTGTATDTFTMTYTGGFTATGPATVGPLAPGVAAPVSLTVSVPPTATIGATDTLQVLATSQGAPTQTVTATITTTVVAPVYGGAISPPATRTAPTGTLVVYTVQLTNTGNITDTFALSYTSSAFPTSGPSTSGSIGAGGVMPLGVSVSVPATATLGATNTVVVTATSQGDPTKLVTTTLATTVTEPIYGVALSPTTASQSAPPGGSVSYSLRITNTGNITDTYSLSYTNGFAFSGPASAGPLQAELGMPLTVLVSVPVTAAIGSTNTLTLVATSLNAPTQTVTATLTTTVIEPVYGVAISPTSATKLGLPGSAVTYTLRVTNTGTVSDTFDVSLTSGLAASGPSTLGPLAAGAGTTLPVTVTIPVTAVPGTSDVLTVRVSSQAQPTRTVTATLTTVISAAGSPLNYVPVVLQGNIGGDTGAYPAGEAWNTPFVVQNLGSTTATVTVDFYSIATQSLALRFDAGTVAPSAALPVRPGNIGSLPTDQQYSAVISATQPVATIVNETAPNRLLSYVGTTTGSSTVYLPNITKNYVGFNTVIYLQNVGSATLDDVTVIFTPFGGGAAVTRTYAITPGAAVAIDPSLLTDLPNDTQFAVTASSATPGAALTAAVNQIAATAGTEAAYSGFTAGASTLYAPNIVRRYAGYNSPVVIQNLGTSTANLTIEYYYGERRQTGPTFAEQGLQGVLAQRYITTVDGAPIALAPGASYPERAHDRPELEDGQYSMVIRSTGGDIVAIVNQVDMTNNTQAMSYDAFVAGSRQVSLPNIVRNYATYQSPFVVQNIGPATATVTVQYFYGERAQTGPTFAEQGLQGTLAATETATIGPNANQPFRIHNVPALDTRDGQYSAVVTATGSDVVAIVNQVTVLALGGSGVDGGSYEGINQ